NMMESIRLATMLDDTTAVAHRLSPSFDLVRIGVYTAKFMSSPNPNAAADADAIAGALMVNEIAVPTAMSARMVVRPSVSWMMSRAAITNPTNMVPDTASSPNPMGHMPWVVTSQLANMIMPTNTSVTITPITYWWRGWFFIIEVASRLQLFS